MTVSCQKLKYTRTDECLRLGGPLVLFLPFSGNGHIGYSCIDGQPMLS
jgi:hypothetical protein